MKRLTVVALILLILSLASCHGKRDLSQPKPFEVTIDWIPSPEYYGFFYAKRNHLYEQAGLDVTIRSGTGAPTVATQIAMGNVYAGTTTSDNILRMMGRGGDLSRVVPLLAYNPSVIAVLPSSSIHTLEDIQGKRLGVNKQSSPYQQLMWLVRHGKAGNGRFQEYPIGYGGAVQLRDNEVDGILAYTTNVVVDLESDNLKPREIRFADYGVKLYGTVLAFAGRDDLAKAGVSDNDLDAFTKATLEGYERGSQDVNGAIDALLEAQPTLDRRKLEIAIRKIGSLRREPPYSLSDLDTWVEGEGINDNTRLKARSLYH